MALLRRAGELKENIHHLHRSRNDPANTGKFESFLTCAGAEDVCKAASHLRLCAGQVALGPTGAPLPAESRATPSVGVRARRVGVPPTVAAAPCAAGRHRPRSGAQLPHRRRRHTTGAQHPAFGQLRQPQPPNVSVSAARSPTSPAAGHRSFPLWDVLHLSHIDQLHRHLEQGSPALHPQSGDTVRERLETAAGTCEC